jgi:hypothetical protein
MRPFSIHLTKVSIMPFFAKVTIHHGVNKRTDGPDLVIAKGEQLPAGFPKAEIERLLQRGFLEQTEEEAQITLISSPESAPPVPKPTVE